MKRVLLDCDGPLSDFDKSAAQYLKDRGFVPVDWAPPLGIWGWLDTLPPEHQLELRLHCMNPGFAANMVPVEGAKQAVKRLQQIAHVYVVTAPWKNSHYWPAERIAWLKKLGFQGDKIVLTAAKYVVTGDILVDDRPENLLKWKEHHSEGVAVLWKTRGNTDHWNEKDFLAINSWSDEEFWSEVAR